MRAAGLDRTAMAGRRSRWNVRAAVTATLAAVLFVSASPVGVALADASGSGPLPLSNLVIGQPLPGMQAVAEGDSTQAADKTQAATPGVPVLPSAMLPPPQSTEVVVEHDADNPVYWKTFWNAATNEQASVALSEHASYIWSTGALAQINDDLRSGSGEGFGPVNATASSPIADIHPSYTYTFTTSGQVGSPGQSVTVTVLAALFAVGDYDVLVMLAGYGTTPSQSDFLSFVHSENVYVQNGSDTILRWVMIGAGVLFAFIVVRVAIGIALHGRKKRRQAVAFKQRRDVYRERATPQAAVSQTSLDPVPAGWSTEVPMAEPAVPAPDPAAASAAPAAGTATGLPAAQSAPADWYPDPEPDPAHPLRMRYFDGAAWTEHYHEPGSSSA